MNINLELDLGERLRLRGYGLDTLLAGKLRLTTPGGRPTLVGDVLAKQGHLCGLRPEAGHRARGHRLHRQHREPSAGYRGDPPEEAFSDPLSDVVKVGVTITGTAQNPRVRLFSEPDMSDTDKLSWLLWAAVPAAGPKGPCCKAP